MKGNVYVMLKSQLVPRPTVKTIPSISRPLGKQVHNLPLLKLLVDLHYLGTLIGLNAVPRSGVALRPDDYRKSEHTQHPKEHEKHETGGQLTSRTERQAGQIP